MRRPLGDVSLETVSSEEPGRSTPRYLYTVDEVGDDVYTQEHGTSALVKVTEAHHLLVTQVAHFISSTCSAGNRTDIDSLLALIAYGQLSAVDF